MSAFQCDASLHVVSPVIRTMCICSFFFSIRLKYSVFFFLFIPFQEPQSYNSCSVRSGDRGVHMLRGINGSRKNWRVVGNEFFLYVPLPPSIVTISLVRQIPERKRNSYIVPMNVLMLPYLQQGRLHCTYNVTLRHVLATVVVVGKQRVLHNLSLCICSIRYPA